MAIKTAVLDNTEAPSPYWAAMDRQRRNTNNKSLYSTAEITRAIRLQDALRGFYSGTFYEPSWGVYGVSVKIGDPLIKERKALREYEAHLAEEGIIKKTTQQGVLYRIKK